MEVLFISRVILYRLNTLPAPAFRCSMVYRIHCKIFVSHGHVPQLKQIYCSFCRTVKRSFIESPRITRTWKMRTWTVFSIRYLWCRAANPLFLIFRVVAIVPSSKHNLDLHPTWYPASPRGTDAHCVILHTQVQLEIIYSFFWRRRQE